jgi:hypothetical protein
LFPDLCQLSNLTSTFSALCPSHFSSYQIFHSSKNKFPYIGIFLHFSMRIFSVVSAGKIQLALPFTSNCVLQKPLQVMVCLLID